MHVISHVSMMFYSYLTSQQVLSKIWFSRKGDKPYAYMNETYQTDKILVATPPELKSLTIILGNTGKD